MFANVVRARVLQSDTGDSGKEVAIKIIRSQESMFVVSCSRLSFICSRTLGIRQDRKRYKS
jgi:serine/threonine-protein kinase PRP4